MESYSNIGGCGVLHPFNAEKRLACEQQVQQRRATKQQTASTQAQADLILAQAAATRSAQPDQDRWTPLAVTGMIVGSLLAIGLLVVIIKKAKAK